MNENLPFRISGKSLSIGTSSNIWIERTKVRPMAWANVLGALLASDANSSNRFATEPVRSNSKRCWWTDRRKRAMRRVQPAGQLDLKKVFLGCTGVQISQLGFGCVGLSSMRSEAEAICILNHAYELGVTHFDTARAYGAGYSELILGNFARGRRSEITIATKFGLNPPKLVRGNLQFVSMTKRILRTLPFLDHAVRRRINASSANSPSFSAADCRASLEQSLRKLGTDYVDFYFLHNARLDDAQNAELVGTAQSLVADGKIRTFGVSSPGSYLGIDLGLLDDVYSVIQTDYNVIGSSRPPENVGSRGVISFATQSRLGDLIKATAEFPNIAKRNSEAIGLDVSDSQVLSKLLVQTALAGNPYGGALIGTRNPDHLKTAALATDGSPLSAQIAAFRAFCGEALRLKHNAL